MVLCEGCEVYILSKKILCVKNSEINCKKLLFIQSAYKIAKNMHNNLLKI